MADSIKRELFKHYNIIIDLSHLSTEMADYKIDISEIRFGNKIVNSELYDTLTNGMTQNMSPLCMSFNQKPNPNKDDLILKMVLLSTIVYRDDDVKSSLSVFEAHCNVNSGTKLSIEKFNNSVSFNHPVYSAVQSGVEVGTLVYIAFQSSFNFKLHSNENYSLLHWACIHYSGKSHFLIIMYLISMGVNPKLTTSPDVGLYPNMTSLEILKMSSSNKKNKDYYEDTVCLF